MFLKHEQHNQGRHFQTEYIYRTGGDEFIILSSGIDDKEAAKESEKLAASLRQEGYHISIGIEYEEYLLKDNISQQELDDLIKELNNKKDINGILLQSPIPSHLNINQAFKKISYIKDVDGFTPSSVGKLSIGEDTFISCTPYGVMKMFEEYNIDLSGKDVVILGRSNIVGKPLVQCCLNKNATVTVCHSKTKNIKEHTKRADILIVAIGKAKFVTKDMVKDGAVVIDIGINRNENGKLVGDVDFENVKEVASYITPVPGGVGPMTIAMLMNNVIKATKEQIKVNSNF